MRKVIIGGLVSLIVVAAGGTSASADEIINVPIDTVLTRADVQEGDVRTLASANVDPNLVGASCVVVSEADNQTSVHPNNDVIVTSGTDEVVIPNVEGQPRQVSVAIGTLTLGEQISVAVRVGPDRQFSGGIIVSLDCDGGVETTTTTGPTSTTEVTIPVETTTTTVAPTTTPPPTVTTEPISVATTAPVTTTPATTITTTTTEAPVATEASTTPTTEDTVPVLQDNAELPSTGPIGAGSLVVASLAFMAGGGALLLVGKRLARLSAF